MKLLNESFEFAGESEARGALSEEMVHELAAELLSVQSEAEFDRFLGGLLKRAGSAVGSVLSSPVMQSIGGTLKGVAKRYLPAAASALGGVAGAALGTASAAIPGIGPVIAPYAATVGRQGGSMLGGMAGRWLADRLEFESMNEADLEFEVAQQFVRVAAESVKNAATAQANGSPADVARRAVGDAMARVAPGLLRPTQASVSGRWVRRGSRVVLYGV